MSREDVSPPIAVPYPGRTVVLPSAGSRGSEDSLPGPAPGPGPGPGILAPAPSRGIGWERRLGAALRSGT